MKELISPIDKQILQQELTPDKFLRYTNNGNNELYVITYHDSPNVMKEIGRLRELTFRKAGGGTGKDMDIDSFDYATEPYKQLISWDPAEKEVLGGYRYKICNQDTKPEELATYKLFCFSDAFIEHFVPYMIELGCSFIQPAYQSSSSGRKTLYALDNLWDGLGALIVENPACKYLFGKVTMYPHFDEKARDLILYFLNKEFYDEQSLVAARDPEPYHMPKEELKAMFTGDRFEANSKILSHEVRKQGENIPPLINAYMNLSRTMKVFGTSINESFGHVEETGIMITVADIYPKKTQRHLESYRKEKGENQ